MVRSDRSAASQHRAATSPRKQTAAPAKAAVGSGPAASAGGSATGANGAGASAGEARAARAVAPPPRRSRWSGLLLLVTCLLLALPVLLIELHRPDVVDPLEARALAVAFQTDMYRQQVQAAAVPNFFAEQLVPHLNGQRLFGQPPGITWANLTMFSIGRWIDPALSTQDRIFWARLGAVSVALLTIAAVFWAGYSIGGTAAALFAALLCVANPVFIYHARIAAAPMHHTAWALLSIAAGLWAIRPFKAAPSIERQFIGWTGCGLTLGVAIYVQGLPALLSVFGAILLLLLLVPNRWGHFMGLVAATLIGVLAVMPWALYVQEHDSEAWRQWLGAVLPGELPTATQYLASVGRWLMLLVLALLPWTLWLIAAAAQPFSASSAGSRVRMLMGWAWFLPFALILPLMPMADLRAQLVPVLPALAVLLAVLFKQVKDLADEGRYVRAWRLLMWPQLILLTLLSLAAPLVLQLQPALIAKGWLAQPIAAQPGWLIASSMMLVLLGLACLSWRWALQRFPAKALGAWALWTIALMVLAAIPLTRSPLVQSPVKADAELLREWGSNAHLYWLADSGAAAPAQPDPAVLVYADVMLPTLPPQRVPDVARDEGAQRTYFVTPLRDRPPIAALQLDAELKSAGMSIWHYPAAAAQRAAPAQP